jgi:diaminopimelate decarboxylase
MTDPRPVPNLTKDALFLDPRIEAPLADLLAAPDLLHSLVEAFGSPLNVVAPDRADANRAAFSEVYREHRLKGTVFFANKANRSTALLRRLAATDAGVDVASLGELRHALGCGFTGDRVVVTGPKTEPELWLAARVGATVQLDSSEELRLLVGLVRRFGFPPVPVMVRLNGFERAGTRILSRTSRFGIPCEQVDLVLDQLLAERATVRMVGVGCHLDTNSPAEKVTAAERCLLTLVDAQRRGLRPRRVDLGGGYGVRYLADPGQWRAYTTALTEAVLGRRAPMTWQGHGYGLRAERGTVAGQLGLYPAARPEAGASYLDTLLRTPGPVLGRPLGTLLLEHLVELDIEPGRALLDQCGLTLARVAEVGRRADATTVRLEANRDDLGFEAGGVLIDPVLILGDSTASRESRQPCQAFLLGNQCLEHDLITHRLVAFRDRPRPGDLLAFVNSAGYFADFTATAALRQPTAATVAATETGPGRWRWCLDEQYWPTLGGNL